MTHRLGYSSALHNRGRRNAAEQAGDVGGNPLFRRPDAIIRRATEHDAKSSWFWVTNIVDPPSRAQPNEKFNDTLSG